MKVEILSAVINRVAQAVQATSIVDVGAGQVNLLQDSMWIFVSSSFSA
jgi:hypothetical protein